MNLDAPSQRHHPRLDRRGRLLAVRDRLDSSVQLPTDAVSADEILNEPGIASIQHIDTILPAEDEITILSERTITVPSGGNGADLASNAWHFRQDSRSA